MLKLQRDGWAALAAVCCVAWGAWAVGSERPAGPLATRQTAFAIPFVIDQRAGQASEVELYVSTDRGTTWRRYDRQAASAGRFFFRAAGDGEYWFASRTLAPGAPSPQPEGLQAELRVVIDTVQPRLELTVRAGEAGQVVTTWRASDPHLAPESLRLAYQPAPGHPWRPIAVGADRWRRTPEGVEGQLAWWPDAPTDVVTVRCEVQDQAGNLAVVTRRVSLPQVARAPASPVAVTPWPAGEAAADGDGPAAGTGDGPGRARPDQEGEGVARSSSPAPQGPPARPAGLSFPGSPPPSPAPPAASPSAPRSEGAHQRQGGPPAGERPRMVRSRRFQLAYELDSVGPSGVAEVAVWGTADGGESWRRWTVDADKQSPVTVETPGDGLYGFCLVVAANNGLASPAPASGQPADIWIAVDTTPPTARLTSALYGEGQYAGQLDIRWTAEDAQLAQRPVTLAYSERPDGPWTTIAAGLPNTGRYFWPVPPRSPRAAYLRLEVRDAAGNTTVDQTPEPVNLAGLAPQAHIRGVIGAEDDRAEPGGR